MNGQQHYPISDMIGTVSFIKLDQRVSQSMNATEGMVRPMRELTFLEMFSNLRNEMLRVINSAFSVQFGRRCAR